MTQTETTTRADLIDALWRQITRPESPRVEVIGEDARLTLDCLADLAYFQHGREIDFETIEGGYSVALGDRVQP